MHKLSKWIKLIRLYLFIICAVEKLCQTAFELTHFIFAPEQVKTSKDKMVQTRSRHWMEVSYSSLCLAVAIGWVILVTGAVWGDTVLTRIGLVILLSALSGLFILVISLLVVCMLGYTPDEDVNSTYCSYFDPALVQGSQNKDEEPPKYEDIERQDALHLPKYHEWCRQSDTIVYQSE